MAGRPHRSAGSPRGEAAPPATPSVELEANEVPLVARVPRHRLAVALAVTMAALPILLLDNFPAHADAASPAAVAAGVTTTEAPVTTSAPTTTAAPPTSTTAQPPIEATIAKITVAPTPTPTPTTAPPTTAPPTTQAPPPAPSGIYGDPNDPATWDRMAQCEAGGNWAANTGNGYYGGLQFSVATWQKYGGTGYPHQASKATQIEIGKRLQAAEGWDAWPGCSSELGYT